MNQRRIILAGGSGFLGNALAKHFLTRGDEVIVFTRRPRVRTDGVREVAWDARALGNWEQFVDGADVVINLAGKSVDCRYNAKTGGRSSRRAWIRRGCWARQLCGRSRRRACG